MMDADSLPADLPLTERIVRAMPDLTPAQQRMAAFVLDNTFRAATMRIDEFADAVGVSLATVNRFSRALGFDGYPQCRAAMVRGFEATLAPIESLRTSKAQASASADVMAAALAQAIENLDWTRRNLDAATCERAVDAILHARRIYVLGLGASGYLAGLLHHGLDPYCENVQAVVGVGGSTHAARQLFKLREGDLVFFKIHRKRISHVGIYLVNNFFVHASLSQGVMISNLNDEYWQRVFAGAGRMLHTNDNG